MPFKTTLKKFPHWKQGSDWIKAGEKPSFPVPGEENQRKTGSFQGKKKTVLFTL